MEQNNEVIKKTIILEGKADSLNNTLRETKTSLKSLTTLGQNTDIVKTLKSVETAVDRIDTKANTKNKTPATFSAIENSSGTIEKKLSGLLEILSEIANAADDKKIEFLPEDQKKRITDITKALKDYAAAAEKAKNTKPESLVNAERQQKQASRRVSDVTAKQSTAKTYLDTTKDNQANLTKKLAAEEKALADAKAWRDKVVEASQKPGVDKRSIEVDGKRTNVASAEKAVAAAQTNYDSTAQSLSETNKALNEAQRAYDSTTVSVQKAQIALSQADETLKSEQTNWQKTQKNIDPAAFKALRQEAEKLGVSLEGIGDTATTENLQKLTTRMEAVKSDTLQQLGKDAQTASTHVQQLATANEDLADSNKDAEKTTEEANKVLADTESITNRMKAFVGVEGAVQLMRRAMQNAISTVKELDAQMTEMAVVTDLDVGDYWDQLPEYTTRANKLGVAIKDVYEASTLYYQQGLKSNEVTALSASTLRMARIANLSAEDATNKMTAALRGFNMEISETNADRVADVYSKLAAITASDVNEISSAMTKTASIASNAGMTFETTAAFLSQIIETTRESAETAGTALKTVIARFQELKKSPDEIGEVDGEIVDANQIETALRSVGVALRDEAGQFRELDDVFLELSAKWDTLDVNTQRYIATIAAGSRQQSRFIAMMSDYGRTQELVTAANSAAGASTEQFNKTLESLESKLNKLSNAWDSFTMSIANNTVIKAGVDLLTLMITAVNKLDKILGKFSGPVKILLLIGALKTANVALTAFSKSMSTSKDILASLGAAGKAAGTNIANSFKKTKSIFGNLAGSLGQLNDKLAQTNPALKEMMNNKDFQPIRQEYIDALNAYNVAVKTSGDQSDAAAAANLKLSQAATKFGSAVGFTTEQLAAGNTVSQMSLTFKELDTLQTKGLTKALIAEYAERLGISEEQALTILLTQAETTANGGLITSVQLLKIRFQQLGMQIKKALAPFAPLLIAVTALAVALGVVIYNSPAQELKRAAKAADEAAEGAQNAKEAYSELNNTLSAFKDSSNTLEDLVVGTTAWRDAVKEVNQEFLDLIEKYPELASLEWNTDKGYFEFNDENAVARVVASYESNATKAESAAAYTKILEYQAEAATNTLSNIDKELIKPFATLSTLTDQLTISDDYLARIRSNENTSSGYLKTITNYQQKQAALEAQIEVQVEAIKQAALETAGADTWTETEKQVANSLIDTDFVAKIMDQQLTKSDYYTMDTAEQQAYENYFKQSRNAAKIKVRSGGRVAYWDENGDKHTLSASQALTEYSGVEANNKVAESQQQAVALYYATQDAALKDDQKQALMHYMQDKTGGALTSADITALKSSQWVDWFTSLTDEQKNLLGDDFQNELQAATTAISSSYTLPDSLTKGMIQTLNTFLDNVQYTEGEEKANQLASALGNALAGYSQEELSTFMTVFSGIDWADADSANSLITQLKNSGLAIKNGSALQILIDQAKDAAHAIRTIDLESFNTTLQSIAGTLKDIKTGTTRTVSSDVYENLVKLDSNFANEFTIDTEGNYVYIGSKIDKLISAIDANTSALLGSTVDTLKEQVSVGEYLNTNVSKRTKLSYVLNDSSLFYTTDDGEIVAIEDGRRIVLKDLMDAMLTEGIDFSKLPEIGNWTLGRELQLDNDEVTEILTKLYTYYTNLANNKVDLATERVESASLLAQTNNGITNARLLNTTEDLDEFRGYAKGLQVQGISYGIDQTLMDQFAQYMETINSDTATDAQIEEAKTKAKKLAAQIGTAVSYKQSIEALQNTSSAIKDMEEEYNNLESEITKINKLQEIANKFGLQVTDENYEQLHQLFVGFVNGNEEAYQSLLRQILRTNGLSQDKATALLDSNDETKWTDDLIQAATTLAAAGLGVFEVYEDGTKKWIAYTKEEILDAVGDIEEAWENPYDWLYQANEKINDLIRQRERLERKYQQALKSTTVTAKELATNTMQQLANYTAQIAEENSVIAKAYESITTVSHANSKLKDIVSLENGSIKINTDAAEKLTGTKNQEAYEELVSKVEEYRDALLDAEERLEDIQDSLEDLQQEIKDAYATLETQLQTALVDKIQKQIDLLTDADSAITEANESLSTYLQEIIDEERQIRDNQEKEQDLTDIQNQINYLSQDTSGSNKQRIQELTKQLQESQEDYQDSLVDQSLDKLSKQNETAQKQRQKQIDIMTAQLQWYQDSGNIWADVSSILNSSLAVIADDSNASIMDTELGTLLKDSENYEALSELQQEDWAQTLKANAALASLYEKSNTSLAKNWTTQYTETMSLVNQSLSFIYNKIDSLGTDDDPYQQALNNIKDNVQSILNYLKVNKSGSGGTSTLINGGAQQDISDMTSEYWDDESDEIKTMTYNEEFQNIIQAAYATASSLGHPEYAYLVQGYMDTYSDDVANGSMQVDEFQDILDGIFMTQEEFVSNYLNSHTGTTEDAAAAAYEELWKQRNAYIAAVKPHYATGGLASFTGPAWLDGTTSKPELVLNPTDTANFIELKDILASWNASSPTSESLGNNYFDINISVDSISDDYDVDQLATKIKSMITDDAYYRNVNAIQKIR